MAAAVVEDVWVQCDDPKCKKWRKLPPGSQAPPDNVKWYCRMNPDPLRNSCAVDEEAYSDHDWDPETDQPRQQPVVTHLPLPRGGKRQKFGGYGAAAAAAVPQFKKPKLQPRAPAAQPLPTRLPHLFVSQAEELSQLAAACRHLLAHGGVWVPREDLPLVPLAPAAMAGEAAAAAAGVTGDPAAAAAAGAGGISSSRQPGVWSLCQQLALPAWVWNGLHAAAPQAAAAAKQALDLLTAAGTAAAAAAPGLSGGAAAAATARQGGTEQADAKGQGSSLEQPQTDQQHQQQQVGIAVAGAPEGVHTEGAGQVVDATGNSSRKQQQQPPGSAPAGDNDEQAGQQEQQPQEGGTGVVQEAAVPHIVKQEPQQQGLPQQPVDPALGPGPAGGAAAAAGAGVLSDAAQQCFTLARLALMAAAAAAVAPGGLLAGDPGKAGVAGTGMAALDDEEDNQGLAEADEEEEEEAWGGGGSSRLKRGLGGGYQPSAKRQQQQQQGRPPTLMSLLQQQPSGGAQQPQGGVVTQQLTLQHLQPLQQQQQTGLAGPSSTFGAAAAAGAGADGSLLGGVPPPLPGMGGPVAVAAAAAGSTGALGPGPASGPMAPLVGGHLQPVPLPPQQQQLMLQVQLQPQQQQPPAQVVVQGVKPVSGAPVPPAQPLGASIQPSGLQLPGPYVEAAAAGAALGQQQHSGHAAASKGATGAYLNGLHPGAVAPAAAGTAAAASNGPSV